MRSTLFMALALFSVSTFAEDSVLPPQYRAEQSWSCSRGNSLHLTPGAYGRSKHQLHVQSSTNLVIELPASAVIQLAQGAVPNGINDMANGIGARFSKDNGKLTVTVIDYNADRSYTVRNCVSR
jgi:hypothetical protein